MKIWKQKKNLVLRKAITVLFMIGCVTAVSIKPSLSSLSDRDFYLRFGIMPSKYGNEADLDLQAGLNQGSGINGTYNIFKQRIFTSGWITF